MEADWEFEIGGDAPRIEADWPGLVNLRDEPWRVDEVAEARELPELAAALMKLNAPESPVWTSKTDVFAPGPLDPDELDAHADEAMCTVACYIDVLMRSDRAWNSPASAEQSCRRLCGKLHEILLRCCRVDLVIRRATGAEANDLGVTVYFSGCGPTSAEARKRLSQCLATFVQLMTAEPGMKSAAASAPNGA